MKRFKFLVAVLATASLFTACKEEVTECDVEGLACTQEIAVKYVSVKTAAGDVVPLDSIVVKKSGDGTVLFSEIPTVNAEGTFKLISDNEKDDIVKEGTDVTFYGYISGVEVANEDLKVGHDCCHVVYIAGTSDIVVSIPD